MIVSTFRRTVLLFCVLALMLASLAGLSEGAVIDLVTQEAPGATVTYPQLSGLDNAFVQDSINQAILSAGGIQSHLDALAAFSAAMPGNLRVSSTAAILAAEKGQGLLSLVVEAEGNLGFGPPSHRYTPLLFSLDTGQLVSCEALFLDCEQARVSIEETLEERLGQELSNYRDRENLFPFPLERFALTQTGISFYYPERSMVWLSGKSAFIHFHYHELKELLRTEEGSLLSSLQPFKQLSLHEGSKADIEEMANSGGLPGLPVMLGDDLGQVLEAYPLLHDPEGFVTGEKYQLEDDRFRGSLVISREGEAVTGILSRRMNLYGFITGQSTLEEIKSALGEPAGAFPLSAEAAGLYGVPSGEMLAYDYRDATLQLFINDNQVLSAVWLDQKKAE